jgi:cell wall-associated NlpC family hydrolase
MRELVDFFTIPYREGGISFAGADCYGIVQLWFSDRLGIYLGDYGYDRTAPHKSLFKDGKSPFDEAILEDFDPVPRSEARENDVVTIRNQTTDGSNHCGVIVAPGRFLHCLDPSGANVSRIDAWLPQITGFFRHKALK